MDIKCNKVDIAFGVKTASRALGSPNVLPILTGIKLETDVDHLKLIATDLERSIIATIPIENLGDEGSYVINGQLLSKITGMLPDESLTMKLDESGDKVIIASGDTTFELLLQPIEDYPELPTVPEKPLLTIARDRLVRALERTAFAAMSAKETSRLNLTGVDLVTTNGNLKFVATNGYRLAQKEEALEKPAPEGEYLIDADALKELQSILSGMQDEEVVISHHNDHLFFVTSQMIFGARVIQEEYPNIDRVIPKDNSKGVYLQRDALFGALQRAEITTAPESGAVVLEVIDSHLYVRSSSAEKGQTEEKVPLLKPVEPIKISFRGEYLIDALRRMSSTEVVIWLKDSESAGLLETVEDESDQGFIYVCMPIRMD
jgi:DNA polymerase-3 subunit beta